MKLYYSTRPHPIVGAGREIRMVLLEKSLALPLVDLDMMAGENRTPAFLSKNPSGQLPALELDDDTVIAESMAIAEFIEELQPHPALIGSTAKERALTRMWLRRIELGITENIANGFRFGEGREFWKGRGRIIEGASDGLKALARDKLAWLDTLIGDRPFIVGERFTLADIVLYVGLDFGEAVGQPIDPALEHLAGWRRRVATRRSATASLEVPAAE